MKVDDEDLHLLEGVTVNIKQSGYVRLVKYHGKIDGKYVYTEEYLHRAIMKPPQGMHVDHINGNRLDNRRSNLRLCLNEENARNKGPNIKNKSGYKGVYKVPSGKWAAQITVNHKCKSLGTFNTAEAAALEYNRAARELHGEFAYQNEVQ